MVEAVTTRGGMVRAGILFVAALLGSAAAGEADVARQILDATGTRGGLVVHLGCGDGKLTAALHAGGRCLVHGLDADAARVAEARRHVQALGLYGPVSIERFDGKRLPYADNLVNLVVAETLGDVPMAEAMRVLAPGGALYAKQDGRWSKTVKPRPANTDEWTHYLHDASGNPVAHDTAVGPPRHFQWIAEPRHTRGHEHIPGIYALVSAGGRIFYIADEASTESLRETPQWQLVARDAYNGLLLWKRPIATWFPHLVNWGATPPQLQRKLVAVGGRVYVTLGLHAPVSALDAATGETLEVYGGTDGTEEIVCHEGVLLLAVRRVTAERTAELATWAKLVAQDKSPVHTRDTAQPLVNRFRSVENKAARAILALDAATGRVLWTQAGPDAAGLRTLSLCAIGDRAIYQKGRDVVCLDLKTGQPRWSAAATPLRVACGRAVVCADGKTVTALAADTGKPLWSQPATLSSIRDAFIIQGTLWLGGFKPFDTGRKHTGPAWGPYFATQRDLATGKVLKHIEPDNPGHHHRCWQNKATDRYILGGRRGAEFIDLETGDVLWHSWVRGVCRYGVMPSNGLLYAPPHSCGCYIAAKLTGFNALAPGARSYAAVSQVQPGRLTTGPAYGESPTPGTRHPEPDAWPAYRHDAARSGATKSAVRAALTQAWQADVGGKLTSPTVAGGKVLVASVDGHRVAAIDAATGEAAWSFTAGARVDSPPTLHQGRAIFGCRDGHVYSLRASDGALAWRLRAARHDRRITASGQLEAASPVNGSVLVQDDTVYLAAGRSSYLDGGIDILRVRPATGQILSTTPLYSPDPETGRQPAQFGPCYMPGALGEILTGDGQFVYLRDLVFDKSGVAQPKGNPHLLTLTGFLDDSWPHRSYWIYGTRCSISTGCSGRDRDLVSARMLVFDESTLFGYGRTRVHWSNQFEDGPYRLFALKRDGRTQPWTKAVAIHVRAMVLAGDVLFVAGPPVKTAGGSAPRGGSQGARLLALSASDGAELAQYPLDATPVFDGMAAARGRLYLALDTGRLICMAPKEGR